MGKGVKMPYKNSAKARETRRIYVAKNREKITQSAAEYRADHPEEMRRLSARYRIKHREEIKARKKRAYRVQRAQMLQEKKEYYAENRKEICAKVRDYRKNNPEKIQRLNKQYRTIHRDMVYTNNATRRARERNAPINDLSAAQWQEIQETFDHRCGYCHRRAKGHLTQDHITPLIKGGSHTFANIVPACRSCNAKKKTGPPLSPVQPLLLTLAPSRAARPVP
jgi:5-methylcytosine-specific restriction endonuclease McrA